MLLAQQFLAELIGTFWLLFGGCRSALRAAAFPNVGIGLHGVPLAFSLVLLIRTQQVHDQTLQIVFEVSLRADTLSHAEDVGWHHVRMQLDIVPRSMPEIARVTEFVVHLCRLSQIKPQGVEL